MAEKEVLPKPANVPPTTRRVNYEYAGKESFMQIINKKFPKDLIPTNRISGIFGAVFIIALLISLAQFPFNKILSGQSDFEIGIGLPLPFLTLGTEDNGKSPADPFNLIIDLFLYLLIAYAIDIILNLIIKAPFIKSEEEKRKKPIIFKDKNPTIAEKVTKKVFEKKPGE